MGIDDELKKLGAVSGDTVRIMDYEFEYVEQNLFKKITYNNMNNINTSSIESEDVC